MKNLILAAIIVLFTGMFSSAPKKTVIQPTSVSFSSNPYAVNTHLATAD
jgi:hypothetical protein